MRAILLIGANFFRTQWIVISIMTVYLIGISGVFSLHEQHTEIVFFLRMHGGYVLFLSTLVAIPAIEAERKSRRILAVLSKGIYRSQYIAGLLCGCMMISGLFCLLLGGITALLCQQGNYPTDGLLPVIIVLFFTCSLAAAVGLFCSIFLHPLLAMGATGAILLFPLMTESAGFYPPAEAFPVAAMAGILRIFQFRPAGSAIWSIAVAAILETIVFLVFGSAIFARRDVTISPE